MAAYSSTIDVKTARLSRCRVELGEQTIDCIDPQQEVGVKRKVKS